MASSLTRATWSTKRWAIGNTFSPTRRGASESAATPPAGASTGAPASSAANRVGEASGSTPTTLVRLAYQAATPAIQATTTHRYQHRIDVRRLTFELRSQRPLTEDRLALVESVHRQSTGLTQPLLTRRQRIGVELATQLQVCAELSDPLYLGWRGNIGDKNFCRNPELHGPVGDRYPMVATRSGNYPGRGDFNG